ncbi:Hypothetical predicted protein [Octopus vulgaris]|uniref:Uncharacterized protein n=1 Tax=Octopus vulgaris TaxID=6645 RepID=A0AA36APL8_OCTVU|nr:Hypothetical predicted protein [Octopus vulgaris]
MNSYAYLLNEENRWNIMGKRTCTTYQICMAGIKFVNAYCDYIPDLKLLNSKTFNMCHCYEYHTPRVERILDLHKSI